MAENDAVLLARYSNQADSQAFSELVRRYAGLVYATCMRILDNPTDAADMTQETFFELTRRSGRISGSLNAWLHKVAQCKSVDLIRRTSRRQQRERDVARQYSLQVDNWHDLSGYVDEALEQLDDAHRTILLDHFLAGKTTSKIAEEQNVSQATVSRRVHAGLAQLRTHLQRRGLLVTGAALGTLLMENTSQAVPVAVLNELSKMAMVGATVGGSAGTGSLAGAISLKIGSLKAAVCTAAAVGVVAGAGYLVQHRSEATVESVPTTSSQQNESLGAFTNEPDPPVLVNRYEVPVASSSEPDIPPLIPDQDGGMAVVEQEPVADIEQEPDVYIPMEGVKFGGMNIPESGSDQIAPENPILVPEEPK